MRHSELFNSLQLSIRDFCTKYNVLPEWEDHMCNALSVTFEHSPCIIWTSSNFITLLPEGPVRWFCYNVSTKKMSELEQQLMTLEQAKTAYRLEMEGNKHVRAF